MGISGCAGSVPKAPGYELCTLLIDEVGPPSWFCVHSETKTETLKPIKEIRLGISTDDFRKLKDYQATLIRWGKDNCRVQ